MKQFLRIIPVLLLALNSMAECGEFNISIFPSGSTIRPNSIFIIEIYMDERSIIENLNGKYSIYLTAGQKRVKLLVQETHFGYALSQAVLKPETALEPGLNYVVTIDGLVHYLQPSRYNDSLKKYQLIKYKVIANKDTIGPTVLQKPKELKKEYIEYGCGPSKKVIFDLPITDSSEVLVKTTLKNLRTGKQSTYIIQPNNNQIHVGHGMCSGYFSFKAEDTNFEVKFSFMDASGNITEWTGPGIKFTNPYKPKKKSKPGVFTPP